MKAGKEHRVPMTERMIAILDKVAPLSGGKGLIFPAPSRKKGKAAPMSDMVFKALFKRMEVEGVTTHGFRSSFRDWGGDATTFPRELLEQALAHKVGDDVEKAYRRSDALEKRRKLMVAWERFLSAAPAQVVQLKHQAR
jgi:integrase